MMQLPSDFIPEQVWPWIRGTKRIVEATIPGRLPGTHLISATDYSGTHSRSRFWVCSCLFADADLSPTWPALRLAVRKRFLNDGRRMAYKALNDRRRQQALPDFLRAADSLTGLLCTVAVDKSYKWMGSSPSVVQTLTRQGVLTARWGAPAFEIMSRVVMLWALLLSCVCRPEQHITWITDEDDIAANDDRLTDLLEWAGRYSNLFINHKMGELAVNTTAIDTGDRGFEDFVSIPDLGAGMMADVANGWIRLPGERELPKYEWRSAAVKAEYLCDWYFAKTGALRKLAIAITREPTGQMRVQRIWPESV